MRKFTNKQAAKIEQWLDEAFNDGYKAAELDAKFLFTAEAKEAFEDCLQYAELDAKELADSLFTAEANMKRAEAEFNKRDQPIEQRVQEQLGHPLYGRGDVEALSYGTPDELYTIWGVHDDN
jgi:hypothetical protein